MLTNLEGKTLPVMWTVTEGTNDLYSIYLNGQLYMSHLPFDEFYPLYRGFLSRLNQPVNNNDSQPA